MSSNINKSFDERIAEGEKELDTILNQNKSRWMSFLHASSTLEEERSINKIRTAKLEQYLLIEQLGSRLSATCAALMSTAVICAGPAVR